MNACAGGRPKLSTSRPARMPLTSGSFPGAERGSPLGPFDEPPPGIDAAPGLRAGGALGSAQKGVPGEPPPGTLAVGDGFDFSADLQPARPRKTASRLTQGTTRTAQPPDPDIHRPRLRSTKRCV